MQALVAARSAARDAASEHARQLAARAAAFRSQRPRPTSAPNIRPRQSLTAARAAATKLLAHNGQRKRTPWGFFVCEEHCDASGRITKLHVGAPAILAWANEEAVTPPPQSLSDVIVARPTNPDECRLVYGPFAFRLSPSSEVLTWLAATTLRPRFKGAHVLELGSGLGFTGLAVAKWCECASVRITDGDPASVALLEKVVEINREEGSGGYGGTVVDASMLQWGEHPPPPLHMCAGSSSGGGGQHGSGAEERLYDVIICADCVYDRALHLPLRATIRRLLKQNGVAYVVASRRCGSFKDFEACAKVEFQVENWGTGYDVLTTGLLSGKKCCPEVLTLKKGAQARPGRGARDEW